MKYLVYVNYGGVYGTEIHTFRYLNYIQKISLLGEYFMFLSWYLMDIVDFTCFYFNLVTNIL